MRGIFVVVDELVGDGIGVFVARDHDLSAPKGRHATQLGFAADVCQQAVPASAEDEVSRIVLAQIPRDDGSFFEIRNADLVDLLLDDGVGSFDVALFLCFGIDVEHQHHIVDLRLRKIAVEVQLQCADADGDVLIFIESSARLRQRGLNALLERREVFDRVVVEGDRPAVPSAIGRIVVHRETQVDRVIVTRPRDRHAAAGCVAACGDGARCVVVPDVTHLVRIEGVALRGRKRIAGRVIFCNHLFDPFEGRGGDVQIDLEDLARIGQCSVLDGHIGHNDIEFVERSGRIPVIARPVGFGMCQRDHIARIGLCGLCHGDGDRIDALA